jgi:DNA-binding transcriptional regulator YiaG
MTAEEVKALREQLGWTQERMARELGVSFATVNRWEKGHRSPSHLAEKTLQRLARRTKGIAQ